MWDRYRRYLEEPPQIILEWSDAPTGAKGWLVINSLRGGAAGGGTRMRKGVTLEEVTYLAKTMELKFAFSGPPIGGAKSGIAFDPQDPRRNEVLRRWFEAIRPYLTSCYGTGGDVNVDEQRDVMPICSELGLRHHQQGIVKGHLRPDDAGLDRILTCIQEGLRLPALDPAPTIPDQDFTVSDLITGFGVVEGTRSLLERRGGRLEGQRVVVEGFGNVGSAAALYFARAGARVVGLLDADSLLVAPDGLDSTDLEDLIARGDRRVIPRIPFADPMPTAMPSTRCRRTSSSRPPSQDRSTVPVSTGSGPPAWARSSVGPTSPSGKLASETPRLRSMPTLTSSFFRTWWRARGWLGRSITSRTAPQTTPRREPSRPSRGPCPTRWMRSSRVWGTAIQVSWRRR